MFALREEVLDLIPMHEIATVQDMELDQDIEDESAEFEKNNPQESEDDDDDLCKSQKNSFILKTTEGGYNSGRKYSIRAKNLQEMRLMVQELTKLSSKAREDAEAKSRLQKFQEKIARVFDSDMIQRFLAILIFSVLHKIITLLFFSSNLTIQ